MLQTLLLFDIDGTLIKGARSARTAFARAIQSCLGVSVDLSTLNSAGKTDYRIMQEIFEQHRLPADGVDWDALRASFLHHIEEAVRLEPGEPCPGVRPLLDALAHKHATAVALGTGNLKSSAYAKLAAHGLDGYFATGGFGDDSIDRNAIITVGITRAQAHHGVRFERVAVIGDTPYDIGAAQANRVHSLCVATGPFDAESLRASGATVVLPDFSQTEAVMRAIDSLPPSGHDTR